MKSKKCAKNRCKENVWNENNTGQAKNISRHQQTNGIYHVWLFFTCLVAINYIYFKKNIVSVIIFFYPCKNVCPRLYQACMIYGSTLPLGLALLPVMFPELEQHPQDNVKYVSTISVFWFNIQIKYMCKTLLVKKENYISSRCILFSFIFLTNNII